MYAHFINSRIHAVQVCNNNLTSMYIIKNTNLKVIQKCDDEEYYPVTLKNYTLVTKHVDSQESPGLIISETKLLNRVTVYDDENMIS